jgi:hypothetical protein
VINSLYSDQEYCLVCGEHYDEDHPCLCSRADEEYHYRKDEGLL